MKSQLQFFKYGVDELSDCGAVLEIEFSSREMKCNWPGVILEKGSSPHFYPQDVYTPYFYFALALEQDLHWNVRTSAGMTSIKSAPGDIWINPPHKAFSHEISEPCFFLILAVEEKTFLDSCPLKLDIAKLQFLNNYNVHDESIKGIMELFLMEAKAKGNNGQAYLRNLLSLLSNHYVKNYSNFADLSQNRTSFAKFNDDHHQRVNSYIERHISEQITVDDLAAELNLSKFYFLREFKKSVGITPYQYLLNTRLERSRAMLRSGENDISSIAFELGFNDQSHFTRSFKKAFGMTPGNFQKLNAVDPY